MKSTFLIICALMSLLISLHAQNPKPVANPTLNAAELKVAPTTLKSAQAAVQHLGNQVIKGNIIETYNKMYPRYKKRQEKRHGKAKFLAQFTEMPKTLLKHGLVLQKYKAMPPTQVYRVWPRLNAKMQRQKDAGMLIKELKPEYLQYSILVIIPTKQIWSVPSKTGKAKTLLREKFQIAIADEGAQPGKEQWTFIDGDSLNVKELRSLFPSLPLELILPKVKNSQLKNSQ